MAQRLQSWSQLARQVIDLRIALVIGLLAFMLAVSFDSGGNKAVAADLANPSPLPVEVTAAEPQPARELDARSAVALPSSTERLYHGTMTGSILTGRRMTGAHFFTDLPTEN